MSLGQPELLLIAAIFSILVVAFWKIFSKAGYPGWLGIGMFFPLLNLLLVLFLAFAEWPIEKRLRTLGDEGSIT